MRIPMHFLLPTSNPDVNGLAHTGWALSASATTHCRKGSPKMGRGVGSWPANAYFTSWLILKIGRMIDIAMKPTMPPIATIINGSIIDVTALIVAFNSLL